MNESQDKFIKYLIEKIRDHHKWYMKCQPDNLGWKHAEGGLRALQNAIKYYKKLNKLK
jgi:hypothetical protein